MRNRDYKWYHYILFALGGIALAAGFAILIGLLVMWLWNWLMVDIFSLPEINYWKAVGLALLARLLFGHIGGGGGGKKKGKKRKHSQKEEKWCSEDYDCSGEWDEDKGILSMIKNEIKTEIRKEIRKEMEKEKEKEMEKDSETPESDF